MAHLGLCSCVYASCVFSSWNAYQSPFSSCVLTFCSSLLACYLCRCCCCWSLCWGCCITLRDRFVFRCDCFAAACSPFLPFSGPLSALLSSSLLVYVTALLVAAAALPSAAAISDLSNTTPQAPLLRLADGPEIQVVNSACSVRKGAGRKVNKHCRFTDRV